MSTTLFAYDGRTCIIRSLRFMAPLFLATCPWVANATTEVLATPASYQNGVVRIGFLDTSEQAIDTVRFPAGPALRSVWWRGMLPEQTRSYGAVAPLAESYELAGFAWSPEITHLSLGAGADATVGGSDSVWETATQLPDTMSPLDSIRWEYPPFEAPDFSCRGVGKWVCMFSGGGASLSGCANEFAPGWSKTFHLTGLDSRHYKFQVCSMEVRIVDTCFWREPWAVHIRWAADSAGNGQFRDATQVRGPERLVQGAGSARLPANAFDILGRRLAGCGSHSPGVLVTASPGGVVLRNVRLR